MPKKFFDEATLAELKALQHKKSADISRAVIAAGKKSTGVGDTPRTFSMHVAAEIMKLCKESDALIAKRAIELHNELEKRIEKLLPHWEFFNRQERSIKEIYGHLNAMEDRLNARISGLIEELNGEEVQ